MPDTTPSTDLDDPTLIAKAAVQPVELSLEERLTLVEAAMTVRLDEANAAYEVNTAHIPTTPVDLTDLIALPLTPTLQPVCKHFFGLHCTEQKWLQA